MTKEEWPTIKRLLESGWASRRDKPLDDGAYISLLAPFSASLIADSVRSLLVTNRHTPKAAEIVAALDREPGPTASQKRQARSTERFDALSPELQAKVMGDIERQHGKGFVRREFPEWKGAV